MDERPINPNWRSFAKTSSAFELGLEEEKRDIIQINTNDFHIRVVRSNWQGSVGAD